MIHNNSDEGGLKMSGMWALLEPLKPFISFDKISIDNAVFQLHCKTTVLFILAADLLVTAQTFIGKAAN